MSTGDGLAPSPRSRVGLVGCVKSKQIMPAPAAELYTSPLFRGRRAAVERTCDRWFILSAAHGLVAPDRQLAPYDVTLNAMGRRERGRWAAQVLEQLRVACGGLEGVVFEVHAGAAYTDHGLAEGLRAGGATVELPVAGLSLGQQLAWYAAAPAPAGRNPRRATPPTSTPRGGSKYAALTRWFQDQTGRSVEMTFTELEEVLGSALPASARRYRPWWANTPRAQAHGWLDAGWKVDRVDLAGERIRFVNEGRHG